MKNNFNNSLFLYPIIAEEINTEINKIKINKSSGPDNIPPKLIKYTSNTISPILTMIFNKCFEEGIYPEELKLSKVIVLHKKEAKYLPENYRQLQIKIVYLLLLNEMLPSKFCSPEI